MEMCRFGLVLLMALCVALPAEAQPPDVVDRYRHFLNQHVYSDMTEARCNSEIRRRGIVAPKVHPYDPDRCKEVNTFIKASSNLVRTVCGNGLSGRFTSGQPFTVVTCTLHSGERPPHCDYRRGHQSPRYITITCDRGWPVHFQEDTIVVG